MNPPNSYPCVNVRQSTFPNALRATQQNQTFPVDREYIQVHNLPLIIIKDQFMQTLFKPSHDQLILNGAATNNWGTVRAGISTVTQINSTFPNATCYSGMTILLFAAKAKQWDLVDDICRDFSDLNANAKQQLPGDYHEHPELDVEDVNSIKSTPEYADFEHNALWFALKDNQFASAGDLVRRGGILSTQQGLSAETLQKYEYIKSNTPASTRRKNF
jgi:hypothetical protein